VASSKRETMADAGLFRIGYMPKSIGCNFHPKYLKSYITYVEQKILQNDFVYIELQITVRASSLPLTSQCQRNYRQSSWKQPIKTTYYILLNLSVIGGVEM
jgi:hypothetical protein